MSDAGNAPAGHEALEAALNRTVARYRALVWRTGYGVYISSAGGGITDANPALVAMLGYGSIDEVQALDMARDLYLDPDERDRLLAQPVGSEFGDWIDTRWKKKDGSPIAVRISARVTPGEEGANSRYEGIVEDVTERQRRDEILRRSERMASLGTTLAGVAHELNNPLAAIMGFAQLLLRKPWFGDDRAALETINHEAIRSAKIVKDLLTLARKREVDRRAPMNINDIAGYIMRTRRYGLETAGIGCELRLDPTIPPVRGDRTQLEQVVLNLISNSEQALRAWLDSGRSSTGSARISVRTRREGTVVILEVVDNGPGIDRDLQSRIWDPFWTTKGEGEGTGLGLSVVHGIITDHGGTIEVDSARGEGARFTVRLPGLASIRPGAEFHDDGNTEHAVRALDVLIVDPEPANLSFLTRFLTSRGHAVLAANEAERALRLADQLGFDAVICDAGLTANVAGSIAHAIHGRVGCRTARFVISTTEGAETAARMEAESPFAVAVVTKPYEVETLRRLIEDG